MCSLYTAQMKSIVNAYKTKKRLWKTEANRYYQNLEFKREFLTHKMNCNTSEQSIFPQLQLGSH